MSPPTRRVRGRSTSASTATAPPRRRRRRPALREVRHARDAHASDATAPRTVTSAAAGDGALTMPVVLLVSNGTANAAEVFAAALANNRARGSSANRRPASPACSGSSGCRKATASGSPTRSISRPTARPFTRTGLRPDVAGGGPDRRLRRDAPATDAVLDRARRGPEDAAARARDEVRVRAQRQPDTAPVTSAPTDT